MNGPPQRSGYQPLTWEQLEGTIAFFQERLVDQPEVWEGSSSAGDRCR